MIKTENFIISGTEYARTYSDLGFKIHGGFPEADYDEAVDLADFNRTYVETNILIDDTDLNNISILSILLGDTTFVEEN